MLKGTVGIKVFPDVDICSPEELEVTDRGRIEFDEVVVPEATVVCAAGPLGLDEDTRCCDDDDLAELDELFEMNELDTVVAMYVDGIVAIPEPDKKLVVVARDCANDGDEDTCFRDDDVLAELAELPELTTLTDEVVASVDEAVVIMEFDEELWVLVVVRDFVDGGSEVS